MGEAKTKVLSVQSATVSIVSIRDEDYICITDLAKARGSASRAADIIKNWMRNRSTLEFLGTWEQLNNPDFKVVEFDHFRMQAGLATFVLGAGQWIART